MSRNIKKQVEMEWAIDANGDLRHISDRSMDQGGYKCICCGDDAVTARGPINQKHFRHKAGEFDRDNYIHNLAQRFVFEDLRNWSLGYAVAPRLCRQPGSTFQWLTTSRFHDVLGFPKNLRPEIVEMELSFTFPVTGNTRRPDIALLRDGELIAIVEICHSHEVRDERLRDYNSSGIPWVELYAQEIVDYPDRPWTIKQCSQGFNRQSMDMFASPLAISAGLLIPLLLQKRMSR